MNRNCMIDILEQYKRKRTMRDLQEELDFLDIDSSIEFGDNDEEVSMEIWKENCFYMKIDKDFNIIKE